MLQAGHPRRLELLQTSLGDPQGFQGLPAGSFGYVWLPALAVIAVFSVLTAPLGARAAHQLPVKKLKRVFASLLYVLAVYMLWKGLTG